MQLEGTGQRKPGRTASLAGVALAVCMAIAFCQPMGCAPGAINAADPGSEEFYRLQLLRCLVDPSCPEPHITQIAMGNSHTCALRSTGQVRCWGLNTNGQLGYNSTTGVSDGIGPTIYEAGDVPLGGKAVQIAAGTWFTCALLDTGKVRCWGINSNGQLGYDDTATVGDGSISIIDRGDINVGGLVQAIGAGANHTCALLVNGAVRCWGDGSRGQMAPDDTNLVGDGIGPSITTAGDVPLGGTAVQLAVGKNTNCALLDNGNVRCWGKGTQGQHGYNHTNDVGVGGPGGSITTNGDVPLGSGVTANFVTAGDSTCTLSSPNQLRCWGNGSAGQHGHNHSNSVGDGGAGGTIIDNGLVNTGGIVTSVKCGSDHCCARNSNNGIRCWGSGGDGKLGYGNLSHVGDGIGLSIADTGDIDLGEGVRDYFPGYRNGCVVYDDNAVRCWGRNTEGALGVNSTTDYSTQLPTAIPKLYPFVKGE